MAAQTVTKVTYVDNETVIGAANLNAIQDAVNNHAGLIDDLGNDKVDKVAGKGLSTNDFNNDAQSKLNNLPTGAQLDTSFGNKVDKRTSGTEVYTHTGSTQGGATLTETPTAGAVPLYGTGGVLKAAAPVADNDVVRKAELDEVVDELSDSTTGLGSKAPAIYETASGAIASFDDGADGMPVKKLVANIDPVQDLHGYDYPWPAGGNVNKLPPANTTTPATHNELTITPYADGKYHAKKTGTSLVGNIVITLETPIPVTTSDYFTPITTATASGAFPINLQDANGNTLCGSLLGKVSSQITSAGTAVKIQFYTAENWSGEADIFPMISSSAVTQWSPYSNICPISGWTGAEIEQTGKNLLPIENYYIVSNGITYAITLDGKIVANGTATDGVSSFHFYGLTGRKYPAGRYILTGCPSGGGTNTYSIRQMTNNTYVGQDAGTGRTLELSQNDMVQFYARIAQGVTVSNLVFEPMLRLASETDSTFEPYTNTTIPVTFPTSAGTVYGGTLDVTNGVLTVDRAIAQINDMYFVGTGGQFYSGNFVNTIKNQVGKYDFAISDRYKTVNKGTLREMKTGEISVDRSGYIQIRNDNYTTAADFKTAEADTQIVYELANPTTYQLAPQQLDTLLGTNNIWTDVGTVDVEYPADTKLYIEQLTKPTEDDMTADHAISAGTFFMIGQKLYLSIASIASGAQIIEGTNARQLSLADALNTLSS